MRLSEKQKIVLTQELTENSGQILELLAEKYQCSFEEVLNCLPSGMVRQTSGERFVEILQAIAKWDEAVTFIIHSQDGIFEVTNKLPSGSVARGFYNFEHGGGGIHGHLRFENCANIYLLERPFRGKATVSLNFVNHHGEAMFKIFAGRDETHHLRQNQVDAMRAFFEV